VPSESTAASYFRKAEEARANAEKMGGRAAKEAMYAVAATYDLLAQCEMDLRPDAKPESGER
jgi:uncharacterized protein with GYD domain